MSTRGALAVLALATQLMLPMIASAAIVQKWQTTPGVVYQVISAGDLNGDGIYDLLTGESPSGSTVRVGIRSGATGALLAQTALAYQVNGLWFRDLDNDGIPEMMIWDPTGHLTCFNSTVGSGTFTQRWSIAPFPVHTDHTHVTFVDFDGNGHPYLVINDELSNSDFYVYTGSGVLVTHVTLPSVPAGYRLTFLPFDFDGDNQEELMVDVRTDPSHSAKDFGQGADDLLWMFQRSGSADVDAGVTGSPEVALGPSTPNPAWSLSRVEYSLPATGPASLRLFDVSGREVRTLVNGPVEAGRHEAIWDGRDASGQKVPAGAYFYELNAGGKRATRRVVRLQ